MTKEIQKGTVICQSGQPADSIHMIIKGTRSEEHTSELQSPA